jgi:hypothetical protein
MVPAAVGCSPRAVEVGRPEPVVVHEVVVSQQGRGLAARPLEPQVRSAGPFGSVLATAPFSARPSSVTDSPVKPGRPRATLSRSVITNSWAGTLKLS